MTLIALRNRSFGLGGGTPQLHQPLIYDIGFMIYEIYSEFINHRSKIINLYGADIDSTWIERHRLCSGVVPAKTINEC